MGPKPADIPDFWRSEGDEVAAVDPGDLKGVWKMLLHDVPFQQNCAIDSRLYESTCSPGANVMAVWFRGSMLQMLIRIGALSAWQHDGEFDDTVFKVAATFPLKRMQVGLVHDGLPFDVKEFVSRVEHAG